MNIKKKSLIKYWKVNNMKKFIYGLILLVLIFPLTVFGKEKTLNIYLFYGDGCPHCAAEEKFLDKYLKEHDNVKLHKYEVWYNQEIKVMQFHI